MGQNSVPRYKAVFISPHLDDAVFSCAAEIRKHAQEGPVLVLNIFTRYLAGLKNRGRVLVDDRFQEEDAAAKLLNFETRSLNELDVSFRRPQYESLGNIFRPPVAADAEWIPELRKKLFSELEHIEFENLYLPLGIGWHVDHILTFLCFESSLSSAKMNHTNIFFYEDTPYCLIPNATRLRLKDLGPAPLPATDSDLTLAPQSLWSAWKETSSAYFQTAMMKNLKPWFVQKAALPVVSFYLYRLMLLHTQFEPLAPKTKWTSDVRTLNPEQLADKVQAMACYKSQFQEFFLNQEDCKNSLSRYAQLSGAEAAGIERFWKPSES